MDLRGLSGAIFLASVQAAMAKCGSPPPHCAMAFWPLALTGLFLLKKQWFADVAGKLVR
jgi:hypothetical protein